MSHDHDSTETRDSDDIRIPLDACPGPARRLSSAGRAAMIDAALDAALDTVPKRQTSRRWQPVVIAAITFGAIGAAAAGVYQWSTAVATIEPAIEPASQPRPSTSEHSNPAPAVALDAGSHAIEPDQTAASDRVRDDPADSPSGPRAISEKRPKPPGKRAPAPTPMGAAGLLQAANDQRKAKRWSRADRLYRRVVHEHEGTHAAYVARIASAAIQLEQLGNPSRALQLYRSALRQDSRAPLAEEARLGIAESLRALGDSTGERRALEIFLARHSDSPLAGQARARLAQLQATP